MNRIFPNGIPTTVERHVSVRRSGDLTPNFASTFNGFIVDGPKCHDELKKFLWHMASEMVLVHGELSFDTGIIHGNVNVTGTMICDQRICVFGNYRCKLIKAEIATGTGEGDGSYQIFVKFPVNQLNLGGLYQLSKEEAVRMFGQPDRQ